MQEVEFLMFLGLGHRISWLIEYFTFIACYGGVCGTCEIAPVNYGN